MEIKESQCDCEKCSFMCQAPCCGTPDEMQALIDAGYGERLMYDNWPDQENILKPALKEHEGKLAPWTMATPKGCTFWNKGKCELHPLGLKPSAGKLAHHSLTLVERHEISNFIKQSWADGKGDMVIDNWKKLNKAVE